MVEPEEEETMDMIKAELYCVKIWNGNGTESKVLHERYLSRPLETSSQGFNIEIADCILDSPVASLCTASLTDLIMPPSQQRLMHPQVYHTQCSEVAGGLAAQKYPEIGTNRMRVFKNSEDP